MVAPGPGAVGPASGRPGRGSELTDAHPVREDADRQVLADHHGAWLSGVNGAEPGIIMPGTILIGASYMQELAEADGALDRGKVTGIIEVDIAGETFDDVVVMEDSNALEPDEEPEIKYFAPGVGQIKDEALELVSYGWVTTVPKRWIPHVTRLSGGFDTEVRFQNSGDAAATMTLTPYLADGTAMTKVDVSVPAGALMSQSSRALFGENDISHFALEGPSTCRVLGSYQLSEGVAAAAETRESLVPRASYSIIQGEWSVVFDGMALVNLGNEPATVTVSQKNADGSVADSYTLSDALAPKAKILDLFSDHFTSKPGTIIEVVSSQPTAAVLLRGTVPGVSPGVLWTIDTIENP